MDKFIGFDIDNKKTIACVVQKGGKDRFATLPSEVEATQTRSRGKSWGRNSLLCDTWKFRQIMGGGFDSPCFWTTCMKHN